MQHLVAYDARKAKLDAAITQVKEVVEALNRERLAPQIVSGGGTGSYYFESCSGVYTELQCGSYAFMDADYGRILDKNGKRIDKTEWENALFILTSVMSHPKPDYAICDAGLKAQSVDSGLPFVYGRSDVKYIKCSDEHGIIEDRNGVLKINEKLRLVPGHCDPTCNVHDWYVGIRNGKVETLWSDHPQHVRQTKKYGKDLPQRDRASAAENPARGKNPTCPCPVPPARVLKAPSKILSATATSTQVCQFALEDLRTEGTADVPPARILKASSKIFISNCDMSPTQVCQSALEDLGTESTADVFGSGASQLCRFIQAAALASLSNSPIKRAL